MGVKNLWDILDSCKKILPLHHLQNKRVCIDLSCWIVQLQNVNKTHCAIKDKLYLKGLFHRLRALIALNCMIIFVTDGSIPSIKVSAYRRRLNMGNEAPLQEIDTNKMSSVRRNMGSGFSCMIKEAKLLAKALGIPCLDGVEEAEAQCAVLNSESLCDACFTSDSDAFLFGARTVYRDICLGDGGHVVCYEMSDIERKLGFGRNSLITLAVLLGSDYSNGVHGVGPESACLLVKSVGDSAVLQRLVSEGMSFVKKPKVSKRKGENLVQNDNNGIVSNLQSKAQFLEVINAYLKPKVHSPDSEAVHRVLGTYSFNRIQLQEECTKFFDWSPEKTDEYILPKIAERGLRRYANLRTTSSQVGLELSINQIPVKCPISSIIKERILKGRDYFEVSWEDMHGLKSSAVPANLVQSACPEKIMEFEERRAEAKKTKQCRARPKKQENKTPMTEVDNLRLKELVVEIEQQTTPVKAASLCKGSRFLDCNPTKSRSEKTNVATLDDLINEERLLQVRGQSKFLDCNLMGSRLVKKTDVVTLVDDDSTDQEQALQETNHVLDHYLTAYGLPDAEVIDLVSPSPIRRVPKCRGGNSQHADKIELIDLENEFSPEHLRRSRELRSFIANIRDD